MRLKFANNLQFISCGRVPCGGGLLVVTGDVYPRRRATAQAETTFDRSGDLRSEIKDNLSTGNQTTIWGPTDDAKAVYTVCMAQHGYRAEK
jgi:hypothetical protein